MMHYKETFHQSLASIPVNFNEFMVGIGYGWIAPILTKMRESDLNPSLEESSWIASVHEIARILGPFFSIFLLDNIGRKFTIMICSFLFFSTWLIILFTRTMFLIFISRVLFGITIGMNDVSSSIYLTENCSPRIRGTVGSFLPLSFYAGVFIEYILATYLSYNDVAIVNTIMSLISVLSIFQLKETPYFLIFKGQHDAALTNLIWLRGNMAHTDVQLELEKINQNLQTEKLKKTSIVVLFRSRENYRSIFVVLVIYMLTMATGYSAINSYASIVFSSTGKFTSNEFTILLGIVQFLAICVSPFIIERFERRTLILLSFLMMAICHIFTTFLYYVQTSITEIKYFPWLIFLSVTAYSSIFAMIYPAIFILRGELLPMSIKTFGSCLAIIGNSFTGFATAKLFPVITDTLGIYVNFILYIIVSLTALAYIYFLLPETRGKSLIDIQKSLRDV